ncbi:hypothetical protein X777_14842 [Ooceraea biroi]|uniref:Uncharacterized protein n=1 Tax=Ooceraea biroi TaxID=2015173 RepID=A0A026WRW4_OOCBI|nr:hypothetical protein X777_14842 [Ooceraea biroi]
MRKFLQITTNSKRSSSAQHQPPPTGTAVRLTMSDDGHSSAFQPFGVEVS